jgi:hypothetical protein
VYSYVPASTDSVDDVALNAPVLTGCGGITNPQEVQNRASKELSTEHSRQLFIVVPLSVWLVWRGVCPTSGSRSYVTSKHPSIGSDTGHKYPS